MTTLKDYPSFNNMQVVVQALGLAVDIDTGDLYYASLAGSGTATKSVWATICSKNGKLSCRHWYDDDMKGVNPIKSTAVTLPDSHFKHLLAVNGEPELLIAVEPIAARYYDCLDVDHESERAELLTEKMKSVYIDFAKYINTNTQVPILESWACEMWSRAGEGIKELQTFGDCLGAWVIDPDYDWTSLVQNLLEENVISFHSDEAGDYG
ncbi:MAG: hypothetical protein AAF702_01690 [Chloroflexota bacterium]